MKISEMINNLQEFMDKHGDIDCWYSEDDEGNGYKEVHYDPSLYYVDEDNNVYTDIEDVEYCDLSIEDVKPICIVN